MEDYELIKDKFKKVINYSQYIDNPKVNDLFDRWAEAKSTFINMFNGELIYEYPEEVSFDLGEQAKENKAYHLIHKVETYWGNYQLARFIEDNRDGLFENKVVIPTELSDGTKISKGMKLVRAFKYFEDNKEALYQIQNDASMIIQEDKIKGKLCLSVHPLDYLSSSENTYNWRSCHSLDGEYRAGNLSYMVDYSTIVCYLKSENDEILPNFPEDVPWNSKKWRMLIHFSDDMEMMFAGRQYPFSSETALEFIRQKVFPKLKIDGEWSEWANEKIYSMDTKQFSARLESPYILLGNKLKAINEIVYNGENARQFNDLLYSSCYDPYYSYHKHKYSYKYTGSASPFSTRFVIGGPVKCLDCGQSEITLSETMRCTCCEEINGTLESENFGYCACCGAHIYLECAEWVHDEPICSNCFSTEVGRCDDCGELFYQDELNYNRTTGESYCNYCCIYHADNEPEEY